MTDIEYKIVRKFRLKHTYIHIRSDACVEVRTGFTTRDKYIKELIEKKSNWIKKKQKQIKSIKRVDDDKFYFLGKLCDRKDFHIENLEDFYKHKAKEIIDPLVQKWSQEMQLFPTFIGYRNNKTRWGSCSAKDRLSFNTNLAKMHQEFIEYVVVHELAHIKHKNHSQQFWQCVENFLPNFKKQQKMNIN